MSDVFQEVDEELKRQQLDKAMRLYGPWIAAIAIVVIAAGAGYTFWKNYQESRAGAAGAEMISGMELLVRGQEDSAAAVFAGVAENGPGGYPVLARLQEAAAQRQAGNAETALEIYDGVAADRGANAEFRDLARYYAGLTALSIDGMGYDDIGRRLEPVADGEGPWRFHAREVLGFAAYRTGDYGLAASHYRQITDNPLSPSSVAVRANEMLGLSEAATE